MIEIFIASCNQVPGGGYYGHANDKGKVRSNLVSISSHQVLHQVAKDYEKQYARAAKIITNNIYVDDCLTGAANFRGSQGDLGRAQFCTSSCWHVAAKVQIQ